MSAVAPMVFVVDDDSSVRRSLSRLLAAAGYMVEALASAREFLAREPYAGPCCLVLDMRMPGMTGLELQQTLAAAGRRLPIVFVTGHVDVPMSVRAMKRGAADLLTKPFDDKDLLAAIQRAVAKDAEELGEAAHVGEIRGAHRAAQPARDRGVRAGRDRHAEQADRGGARHRREDGQGAPRASDGEDAGRIGGRAGSARRPRGRDRPEVLIEPPRATAASCQNFRKR
jgi:FixJ family two-component response regulator